MSKSVTPKVKPTKSKYWIKNLTADLIHVKFQIRSEDAQFFAQEIDMS